MADGSYISKQSDIELIFGTLNIQRWADADNSGDAGVITARLDWANEYAEQEFLGRIAEGPYSMEDVRTTKPKMVIYICASLAGVYLYDTRRVVDSQSADEQVAKQRKNVDRWIAQIMAGQLKLMDPVAYTLLKKTAQNSPSVSE